MQQYPEASLVGPHYLEPAAVGEVMTVTIYRSEHESESTAVGETTMTAECKPDQIGQPRDPGREPHQPSSQGGEVFWKFCTTGVTTPNIGVWHFCRIKTVELANICLTFSFCGQSLSQYTLIVY